MAFMGPRRLGVAWTIDVQRRLAWENLTRMFDLFLSRRCFPIFHPPTLNARFAPSGARKERTETGFPLENGGIIARSDTGAREPLVGKRIRSADSQRTGQHHQRQRGGAL
jgi:hypothetical protein